MRKYLLIFIALLITACQTYCSDKYIPYTGAVSSDFSEDDVNRIAQAMSTWNYSFHKTAFQLGDYNSDINSFKITQYRKENSINLAYTHDGSCEVRVNMASMDRIEKENDAEFRNKIFYNTILHEFGHVLGITTHVKDSTKSLMNAKNRDVNCIDQATIDLLCDSRDCSTFAPYPQPTCP